MSIQQLFSNLSDLTSGNLLQTALTITLLPVLITYANQIINNIPIYLKSFAQKIIDASLCDFVETSCRSITNHTQVRNDLYGMIEEYVNEIVKTNMENVSWETGHIVEAVYPCYKLCVGLNINQSISFWVNTKDWSVVPKQTKISTSTQLFQRLFDFLIKCINFLETCISFKLENSKNYLQSKLIPKPTDVLRVEIKRSPESKEGQLPQRYNFGIKLFDTKNDKLLTQFIESIIADNQKKKTFSSHIVIIDSGVDVNDLYTTKRYNLDSLLLDDCFKNKLRSDLIKFWSEEKHYSNICQPHRRGYLLMGPPGCGKSSIIKCLQQESPKLVELTIVKMSSSIKENETILKKLKNLTRGPAIWVFEDIDCVGDYLNQRKENDESDANEKREGLAEFLNTIDGIGTPEGIMIVFTSNYPKNLDSALTRTGRMDRIWNVGPVTDRVLIQNYFYRYIKGAKLPDELFDLIETTKMTPSFIVKLFGIYKNVYEENDENVDSINFMKVANDFLNERSLLLK